VPRRLNNGALSSMQKQTQKRLKSGFKIISWTVSTLEGGGSIMLPALYKLSSLRFWLARNARAYTSARSIGFCVIWVCISSSSSSRRTRGPTAKVGIMPPRKREKERKRKSPRKQKAAVLTTAVLTAAPKTRRTRGPPGRERKNIDLGWIDRCCCSSLIDVVVILMVYV